MKFLLILLIPFFLCAGKYGEHKKIGDKAFEQAIQQLMNDPVLNRYFKSNEGIVQLLKLLGVSKQKDAFIDDKLKFAFGTLKIHDTSSVITYGDLTGLGDHVKNPYDLATDVKNDFSTLFIFNSIIQFSLFL